MEIDLLTNYPKTKRDTDERVQKKTNKIRAVARKFDKEFFDGDRKYGYGGFQYNKKYWSKVVVDFKKYYKLNSKSKILDIGCAKGFMLYDFKSVLKSTNIYGIDISEYAIINSLKDVRQNIILGDARELPFKDNYFDLVISISTIHNLNKIDCAKALKEIQRVTKKDSYITVDAYRNLNEKKRIFDWNLTAKTIMSTEQWKIFFKENGYYGDYYWFIP